MAIRRRSFGWEPTRWGRVRVVVHGSTVPMRRVSIHTVPMAKAMWMACMVPYSTNRHWHCLILSKMIASRAGETDHEKYILHVAGNVQARTAFRRRGVEFYARRVRLDGWSGSKIDQLNCAFR